jgi:hypothetical protein
MKKKKKEEEEGKLKVLQKLLKGHLHTQKGR